MFISATADVVALGADDGDVVDRGTAGVSVVVAAAPVPGMESGDMTRA
jgi:hypothetical protein